VTIKPSRLGGRIEKQLGTRKVQLWAVISVLLIAGFFVVVWKYFDVDNAKNTRNNYDQAFQDLFNKNYDEVIQNLTDVEKLPELQKEQAYTALGQAYFAKANYDKALENYQKAASLAASDKKKSYYNNLMGNCLRENKDKDGAVAKYKLSVQLDPKNELAWVNLINLYKLDGDIANAKNAVKDALVAMPGNETIKAIEQTL
jgi:tetratricopeptide (TPR) repeat protein